jgi:hypothetical protein
MSSLPALQVTVDSRRWTCILDVRLALAKHGPTLALRLADELRVCLVPTLWDVLDNTSYFDAHPEALYSDPLGIEDSSERAIDARSLRQWERARTELGPSALPLFWAGEMLSESALPKDMDSGVIDRFDLFGENLEQILLAASPDSAEGEVSRLLDGGMAALALAAAMTHYRPVVLTVAAETPDDTPPLCRLLEHCGLTAHRLTSVQSSTSREFWAPMLVRCGALELLWAGLPLVALHLVVPGASIPPAEDDMPAELVTDPWQGTTAFWYPLP